MDFYYMGSFFYDKKGYPRWKSNKALVHRTVAAKKFGGKLPKGAVVHHKDGNKGNFRSSNVTVMTRSKHASLHARKRQNSWW
jgi:hypothetical protein